jgi:hypothetical protein
MASSKRSGNNAGLLSFQKDLGKLIKHNEAMLKNLRSHLKEKSVAGSLEQSKA